jgi:hypothetical protein
VAVSIGMVRGGVEAGHEEKKMKERRSSFSDALLVAWRQERWAGNGYSEAVGAGKVAATTIRRRSARSGHRPGSEADTQGPHGFVFFPNYPNWLKLENWCLTMLQKIPIFACAWFGVLLTMFSIVPTSNSQHEQS